MLSHRFEGLADISCIPSYRAQRRGSGQSRVRICRGDGTVVKPGDRARTREIPSAVVVSGGVRVVDTWPIEFDISFQR